MFTGLVEGQGVVRVLTKEAEGLRLSVAPAAGCFRPHETAIGDSIAISGCCLTVVHIDDETFDFQAGEETLAKTSLGELREGDTVNLERSLAVGARLGGHFVQGHVDTTGTVDVIDRSGDWVDMWFRVPEDFTRLMVPKGSIAVDGISLTLVNVERDRFSVALIPHTLDVTTLGQRAVGGRVNIETDVLGKYVAKLLTGKRDAGPYDFNSDAAESDSTAP